MYKRQHPAILFDFGKELQGGLQIVTGMPASHAPVTIRVRLGESVSEAMCDLSLIHIFPYPTLFSAYAASGYPKQAYHTNSYGRDKAYTIPYRQVKE